MKRKIMKLFLTLSIGVMMSTPVYANVVPSPGADSASATKVESISARTDHCEWRYKVVNGKVYKRLYNTTKKKWVTDWILA